MSTAEKPINISEATRKVDVDNRVSLRYYYRIADNLLQEANIHRDMKNVIDLYVVLLKFSSLLSETIPCHKDYTGANKPEKDYYKKKLLLALKELESLKPEVGPKISRLNKAYASNKPVSGLTDDHQPAIKGSSAISLNIPLTRNELPRQQTCSVRNGNMKGERWVGSMGLIDSISPKIDKNSSTSCGSSSCVVCFDAGIEGACVPCGHMAGCIACLNEIKANNWGCPVCRAPIQQVLRLYAV